MKKYPGMSELYGKKLSMSHSSRVITGAGTNLSCPTFIVSFVTLETMAGIAYPWKPTVPIVVVWKLSNAFCQVIPVEPFENSALR